MGRLCWVLVAVLTVSSGTMAYKFILSGSVEESDDGRLAVQLYPAERDLVLEEMRTFLASVQQITQGVASNDFESVAKAARRVGRAAQQGMPGSLVGKLPIEFKKMGFDTHAQFTQLALDAVQMEDAELTMKQLGVLLQNCVACHETYKFEVAEKNE